MTTYSIYYTDPQTKERIFCEITATPDIEFVKERWLYKVQHAADKIKLKNYDIKDFELVKGENYKFLEYNNMCVAYTDPNNKPLNDPEIYLWAKKAIAAFSKNLSAEELDLNQFSLSEGYYIPYDDFASIWDINYGTGAGDFEFFGSLDAAQKEADKNAAYTGQGYNITNDMGETYVRPWNSLPFDPEENKANDIEEDPEEIIDFGKFGYYSPWIDCTEKFDKEKWISRYYVPMY